MGYIQIDEEMRRRKQEKRDRQYEDINRMIDKVEKNRNFQTEEELLQEEKRKWQRNMKLLPILCSISLSIIGWGFFSVGLCMVLKIILSDTFWLGICFLLLSIIIFIIIFPLQRKIYKFAQSKYRLLIKKQEEEKEGDFSLDF